MCTCTSFIIQIRIAGTQIPDLSRNFRRHFDLTGIAVDNFYFDVHKNCRNFVFDITKKTFVPLKIVCRLPMFFNQHFVWFVFIFELVWMLPLLFTTMFRLDLDRVA